MVKRKVVGAGYGINSWLQQRVTALLMLIFGLWLLGLVFYIGFKADASLESWHLIMSMLWVKLITQLFFIALVLHVWIGVRDIWMDYVTSNALRLLLHVLTIIWLVATLIYSIHVIWS